MDYSSILITGATGYFGYGFVEAALRENLSQRICIFSRDEYKQSLMRLKFGNDPRLRWFIGDVRDVDRLRRAMEGVELVVHAAALKRVEVGEYCSDEMVKTNVMGSMNVIQAALEAHVQKVVALSTDKACEPINAYGASKLLAEKMFLNANNVSGVKGTLFAVCRYGNVAGSTGSVIPTWYDAMRMGKEVSLTDPECTRFWMTRAAAVDLVLRTAEQMAGGELVIPDLPAYRLGDLAQAIGAIKVKTIGLGPGEKMHESMRTGETSAEARRMSLEEIKEGLLHV